MKPAGEPLRQPDRRHGCMPHDLIRVNGYDEGFTGWGREDTELAVRLNNSGIRQQCMKFRGVVFHLYHGKQDRTTLSANDDRYKQSIREHRTRCEKGLDSYLTPETSAATAPPEKNR